MVTKKEKIILLKDALKQLTDAEKERKLNSAQKRRKTELKKMIEKIQIQHQPLKVKKENKKEDPIITKKTVNELKMSIHHIKTSLRGIRYSTHGESIYHTKQEELGKLQRELIKNENKVRDPVLEERVIKLEQQGLTKNEFEQWLITYAHPSDIEEYRRNWIRIKNEKLSK